MPRKNNRVTAKDLSKTAQRQLSKVEGNRTTRRGKGRYTVSAKSERTVSGIVFDSKLEARFYAYIRDRVPEGELHLQPQFLLQEKFRDSEGKAIRAIAYKADFLLGPARDGDSTPLGKRHVVIDAKGHLTDIFRIKAKMFSYRYNSKLWLVKNIKQLDEALNYYEELRGA